MLSEIIEYYFISLVGFMFTFQSVGMRGKIVVGMIVAAFFKIVK